MPNKTATPARVVRRNGRECVRERGKILIGIPNTKPAIPALLLLSAIGLLSRSFSRLAESAFRAQRKLASRWVFQSRRQEDERKNTPDSFEGQTADV